MTEVAYTGIVDEIRRRIESGRLRPGDRVPSTRRITKEWGVAMATATKVLTALREEGLVVPRPGIGTVVADADADTVAVAPERSADPAGAASPAAGAARRAGATRRAAGEVTRERVLRTAIAIADTEGAAALSMRRVATALGVSTMSLYRHVPSKDELLVQMADTVFGDHPFPADPPPGWRAGLEVAARLQWAIFRRHPWAVTALSLTRPRPTPRTLAFGEGVLRVLAGTGLDEYQMFQVYVAVFGYVRGIAAGLEWDAAEEHESGVTLEQHLEAQDTAFADVTSSGGYPTFVRVMQASDFDLDLDEQFEFGLRHLLDGFTANLPGFRLR
ncbi:MAG TPA: TetR/AcrR family transcriptional regulator C-terminal domain-containing protein [Actinophytocola sp.]|nr:TetR/AcrR family transcriptional regulator C-terminal domain-containing protein [Actinophytocola sp.]